VSFLGNVHVVHVKKRSHVLRNETNELLAKYCEGIPIIQLAQKYNYPPYLIARLIVEKITCFGQNRNSRKAVTEAMRDPTQKLGRQSVISTSYLKSEKRDLVKRDFNSNQIVTRLASEVLIAINSDPLHGPRIDREKQITGLEHEIRLEQALTLMEIPFETEEQLRIKGTSRTPDVLLSCPVGIKYPKKSLIKNKSQKFRKDEKYSKCPNSDDDDDDDTYDWKMVCWIDSKALYGDVNTHKTSVLPQAETYVHRFGPGLVIYWFGHAPIDLLGDAHGDVCVTSWSVPKLIMLPDGELVRRGSSNKNG
jgi:hypothetical protein